MDCGNEVSMLILLLIGLLLTLTVLVTYTWHAVVSVMALGSNVNETKKADEVCDTQHEDGGVAVSGEDSATDNSDHIDSSGYRRRSLRGRPRVPSAVDTSRLNKHLTNIWSSKRKKTNKKYPSSAPVDSAQADKSDLMESEAELSDHVDVGLTVAAEESTALNSQASTVIIVKTLPQKEAESYHSPPEVNRVSEDKAELAKGSRDIAERLKAKKERLAASLVGSGVDASVNRSGQVTCELCADVVDDYVELVRHVCQQHEDCTYVRSYLDEIQPIANALSAVSLPCKACRRTFAGQAALAAHRHECSAAVSKLGAQRRRVTASLLSPSEHAVDRGQQNGTTKRSQKPAAAQDRKCVHCKRTFTSQDKLAKHVARVHDQKDMKQRASGGRRGRPHAAIATSKPAAVAGSQSPQQANSAQLSSASSAGKFQRCDHCSACFSRTSLLVTHMKYCLKADHGR